MLNSIAIMGRITKPLELKTTPSGVSKLDFCIANDDDYVQKESGERKATFVNVRAWRQTADFVNKFFDKGRMIAIHGRLCADNYTDSEGNKKTYIYVQAENVYFADSKRDSSGQGQTEPTGGGFKDIEEADGDLPF